ncbi:MAG: (Fe-S)-binding protein [Phycisphaerae bacterium]
MLSNRDRLRRALWLARLAEVLGVRRWLADGGGPAWLPAWVRPMAALLPAEAPAVAPLRSWVPPRGAGRGTASLFAGCVNEAVLPQINRATVRVLSAGGYGVRCPERQVCCGAIHEHAGDLETARALARRNIDALSGDDAVLVNVAGCGAMLKRYPALLADDRAYASPAARFAARVVDVSEFWARRLSAERLTPQAQTVAYHDACHLAHAQGIRRPPREMLTAIPGLKLVELPESEMCCGAAGTYNLRHAQTAGELARRKIANVRECGATCVAAGNAGCLLHLSAAARAAGDATVRFVHPIELVAAALPGDR